MTIPITLVFVACPISIKEKEQILVDSESAYVRVERYVYTRTVCNTINNQENKYDGIIFYCFEVSTDSAVVSIGQRRYAIIYWPRYAII
jgi:hypothetical protein